MSLDQIKQWWLDGIKARGLPLHDPNQQVKKNDLPTQWI